MNTEEATPVEPRGSTDKGKSTGKRKGRSPSKPFPMVTFEDALELALAIQEHAAGQRVRRDTLFTKLQRSPSSGPTRDLITVSSRYGLTTGNYNAEFLALTEDGALASSSEATPREKTRARFKLAIGSVEVFDSLYKSLVNKRLPSREVVRDQAGEFGVEKPDQARCVDIFVANSKFVGILTQLQGADRIQSIEAVLDQLPPKAPGITRPAPTTVARSADAEVKPAPSQSVNFETTAFVIAPIGDEGTEQRKHSDMVLGSLIEKAIDEMGLHAVRADKISTPGMINAQVIQYVMKSKVVIADLSFHNPNAFYELAIRHMTGLPTVHIIRGDDKIPFDLQNFRTVTIHTTDKYDLVAQLEGYVATIANHVRQAIESGGDQSNPIRAFFPTLKVILD